MNKKGQEMSVSTLVLIVIGIIVLVLLVLGFSMGWQNLWEKINIFGGGTNLDTIVQACNIAASADTTASYCEDFKLLRKGEYVTCHAPDVESRLTKPLSCVTQNIERNKCLAALEITLGADGKVAEIDKTKVNENTDKYNGKLCKEWLATALA